MASLAQLSAVMKYFPRVILFLLLCPAFLRAQDVIRLREELAKSPAFKDAQYSVYARYADGADIISINPDLRLAPASTLKLYTTAAALDALGPDFVFKTEIYASGRPAGKKLYGDIYVKGGGDPTLGSIRMPGTPALEELTDNWARAIKTAGIENIKGNIYADNSVYGGVLLPWRTTYQNIGSYYAAAVDGLSARDNSYEIYFEPCSSAGEAAKVLRLDPQIKGLEVISRVKAYKAPGGEVIYVNFAPGSSAVEVFGGITVSKKPLEVSAAMPNPALFFAQYFKAKLAEEGVKVKGSAFVLAPRNYEGKRLLITHLSPPLADIVRFVNKRSFNFYADTLLRALSAYQGGDGSAQDGARRVRDFLVRLRVDNMNFEVFDGSGLARDNIASCRTTVDMLEAVLKQPYGEVFLESLPLAGDASDNSTMAGRLAKSGAAYNARVKTGSLDRARAHAGYVKDARGRDIVFCIMTNNFKGAPWETNKTHEAVIDALANLK